MTPAATPEALAEALARSAIEAKFGPEGVSVIFDTPDDATDHQRAVLSARAEEARRVADFAIAGPLAPLLAALQQVTAERDEARVELHNVDLALEGLVADTSRAAAICRWIGQCQTAEDALATVTAEAASLRAEVEAAACLIDRLQACHEGRPVRDLPEATSAYQAARAATAGEGRSDA
ncbi:UNVERIFIED_CONTAM: hypothetical protein Q9R58_04180 [Methylobacteriaceae bacterium AG10]|nr:hypothetical protein [Methylobacteriaceae bacterium AG10]